jgi:hypothetical protein
VSLDVWITAVRTVGVYEDNITHNLNKMAMEVKLSNGRTLYDVLWRPDEHNYTKTSEIAPLLTEGLMILRMERERFLPFNAPNGWGKYEDLVEFTQRYLNACLENLDGMIGTCR